MTRPQHRHSSQFRLCTSSCLKPTVKSVFVTSDEGVGGVGAADGKYARIARKIATDITASTRYSFCSCARISGADAAWSTQSGPKTNPTDTPR